MAPKIQVRRATTAEWASANPVLSAGEFGYDTTDGSVKVGDGTTAWSSLTAIGGGGGVPASTAESDVLLGDGVTGNWKKQTLAQAKTALGIGALAPIASPTFTGVVTTAGQIAFPAAANVSSDPNTLDDYEEGTFTPALNFTVTNGDLSYSVREGNYVKIGSQVTVWLAFQFLRGTASGDGTITGLPYSAVSHYANVSPRVKGLTSNYSLQGYVSGTTITLELIPGSGAVMAVKASNFAATTSEIYIAVAYSV